MRDYYVYILTNRQYTVLYTGVTNDLERRLEEHQAGDPGSFTARYRLTQLVHYEKTTDIEAAIAREKAIKGWTRARKIALIELANPDWRDLSNGWPLPTRPFVPQGDILRGHRERNTNLSRMGGRN